MNVGRLIGRSAVLGMVSAGVLLGSTAAAAAVEDKASNPEWVTLSGSGSAQDEVPAGTGDGDAEVTASLSISPKTGKATYTVAIAGNSEPLTVGHLHQGKAGSNGDVVAEFDAETINNGKSGTLTLQPAVAKRIVDNPQNYYVNTHSPSFLSPAGVARAQLAADAKAPELIDTGTGGQAAAEARTGVVLAGAGVLVLGTGAALGTAALRRRTAADPSEQSR